VHDTKMHDYGTAGDPYANIRAAQEFGIDPWVGSILRGNDKMARIKSFIDKGELKHESVKDSLIDLANYAIIALILFEEAEHFATIQAIDQLSDATD
jgi:Nucleotide modification associated domain 1